MWRMEPGQGFSEQVRLLVNLLPQVARQECFALKGGTAINLFVRDMPRLSVDIDLAYLPVEDRDTSLAAIDAALRAIAADIGRVVPGCKVQASILKGTAFHFKLLVALGDTVVKVEVTPVLRGSLLPPVVRDVTPRVRNAFGYARIHVLAFEDLYAGKLCAALDRQHPRDLYDVRVLLDNEGITPALKDAFLVYLLAHNRPMVELLNPTMQDIEPAYRAEFAGMVLQPVGLDELVEARSRLIQAVRGMLTDADKRFLLAVKRGEADWSQFAYPQAVRLPAIKWKLHNLGRMTDEKRRVAAEKLEAALFG
jgi:hypothetical protein